MLLQYVILKSFKAVKGHTATYSLLKHSNKHNTNFAI